MSRLALALSGWVLASPAAACETALLLAIDVSGSISNEEYVLQMHGLADALGDPDVIAALVGGQDKVALVHWSGLRNQRLSLPWQHLQSAAQVADLAAAIRTIKRPQDHTDTAIGAALYFSLDLFSQVPDCQRHVIDISGDGAENASTSLPAARAEVEANDITLNAIAIEENAEDTRLTGYFRRFVITSDGFVVTAQGLTDYPRAIHEKLLRELTKSVS
jgi:Ca-activated chloride channel homolog